MDNTVEQKTEEQQKAHEKTVIEGVHRRYVERRASLSKWMMEQGVQLPKDRTHTTEKV